MLYPDYPRANDDYESTTEPNSVTINPLLNDVDPDKLFTTLSFGLYFSYYIQYEQMEIS